MTKKIFRSILLVAGTVLLASLIIIWGCLYGYFAGVQETQLQDELGLAAVLTETDGEASRFRLTWIAADGTVLYDTDTDAAQLENHAERTEVQQALDKTLAKEFAMRFSGIIGCAILLSVGLVDQATTFAEGHGGGGGGSDMPWGRREDEDERKWLMRCLMQGARMMHPRVGQKKKR